MKSDWLSKISFLLGVLALPLASLQASSAPRAASAQEAGPPRAQGAGEAQRIPLFGKITAMHDSSIQILDTNGDTVTVNLTGKTEFRKDRQAAKRTDFKVGDVVIVRGEENPDHTWTAQVIGARSMNGPNGRGDGPGGGPGGGNRGDFGPAGTLGKDFVTGEIKSIDTPKLSVLRTDNVTQTIELNEETSLRKGRDSVTMADIQVGDHLFARGALQNDVFVPKMVMVVGPEQWKRMQEMGGQPGGQRRRPAAAADAGSDAQKPPEPQN
jgi:Domain of unknown function (DUF5666)